MLNRLEDQLEDAARNVWEGARSVLQILLLAGWSGLWLLLLLIGSGLGLVGLQWASAGVLVATALGVFARHVVRRRRLEAKAGRELLARAQLENIRLDRNMADVLRAFDLSYGEATYLLETHALLDEGIRSNARRDLDRIREHLWSAAVDKTVILRNLRRMGRGSEVGAVRAALEDARDAATQRQRQAEQILSDARALNGRLLELRQLSSGEGRAVEQARGELREVISELDRTAQAYQEIEAAENETERKLRALRAQKQRS